MTTIHDSLADSLKKRFSKLSYGQSAGKLFSDKSYGFDTLFFCSRFISRFSNNGIFDKSANQAFADEYIKDVFNLSGKNTGLRNYLNESINLLCFCKALEKTSNSRYRIIDKDLLDIYSSSVENAYIAQYMLAYCVFQTDGIWPYYIQFHQAPLRDKQKSYELIINQIKKVATNVHRWDKPVAKFPTNILSYANHEHFVSRGGKVTKNLTNKISIAVNVAGTRSRSSIKYNSYLDTLADSYIQDCLHNYLLLPVTVKGSPTPPDGYAASLADTKMDLIESKGLSHSGKSSTATNKYIQITTKARTVQSEFKDRLRDKTPHTCPICGFPFDKILTASHIKPYSKCDSIGDVINPDNGFLLCPVCDKLFEEIGEQFITIDKEDGHLRYVRDLDKYVEFKYLHGARISQDYLTEGRKKFLKWHNDQFDKKHHGQSDPD